MYSSNMTIIIIVDNDDTSYNETVEWIFSYGGEILFLNFFKLNSNNFEYIINNNLNTLLLPYLKNPIKGVWFRSDTSRIIKDNWPNQVFLFDIKTHIFWELEALKQGLFITNTKTRWLSKHESIKLNKIQVLRDAKRVGLKIPETFVTNSKKSLKEFLKNNGKIICKAAFENISHIKTKEGYLKQFVEEIDEDTMKMIPETFFPSLFQRKIPKEFDARVFYLNGRFYSMAIFSTCVDFRADYDKHRNIPLKLPDDIEQKIVALMEKLDLNTGSIDFVKSSEDGQFYFLEVNPNGQFGMVSEPCNYYIEREIAKYLCHVE